MSSTPLSFNLGLLAGAFISGMVGIGVSEWKLRRDKHGRYLDKQEEIATQILQHEGFNFDVLHANLKHQLRPAVGRVIRHLWPWQKRKLRESWRSYVSMTNEDLDTTSEEFLAAMDIMFEDMPGMENATTARQRVINNMEMLAKPIGMIW